MVRPELSPKISIEDFKNHYWLKKELIQFCKNNNLDLSGGKIVLIKKIEDFLTSGNVQNNTISKKTPKSKFDWHSEKLTLQTLITDNYKNTQNVRRFFEENINTKFNFSVDFMSFMKTSVGKNLEDAINEWHRLNDLKKSNNYKSKISPQFEYNQYIRDFLTDNKDKNLQEAISCWHKKKLVSGNKKYTKEDLKL